MNEKNNLQEFRSKFRVEELLIAQTTSWSWSVRPGQPTLGSGVVSLNRPALQLSDVTTEEMAELSGLISILESTVKKCFDYNIMNYLMLMMVDHHVHYHVIPRYDSDRNFADLLWNDNGWPALPALAENQHQDNDGILLKIKKTLADH